MLRNTNNQTKPLEACANQVTARHAQKLWKENGQIFREPEVNGPENSRKIRGSFTGVSEKCD